MTYLVDVQEDYPLPDCVARESIVNWVQATLSKETPRAELTIRIVDQAAITHLNATYRQKDKPTNVLSFPANIPDFIELDMPLLGDVIICPDILHHEADNLCKPLVEHWAHIVVHGVLHLLNYDHIKKADAIIMQTKEIKILTTMGYDNPY